MSRRTFKQWVVEGGFTDAREREAVIHDFGNAEGHIELAALYHGKHRLGWWTLDEGARQFGEQVGEETAALYFRKHTLATLPNDLVNLNWWLIMNAVRFGPLFQGNLRRLEIADTAHHEAFIAKFTALTNASLQPAGTA